MNQSALLCLWIYWIIPFIWYLAFGDSIYCFFSMGVRIVKCALVQFGPFGMVQFGPIFSRAIRHPYCFYWCVSIWMCVFMHCSWFSNKIDRSYKRKTQKINLEIPRKEILFILRIELAFRYFFSFHTWKFNKIENKKQIGMTLLSLPLRKNDKKGVVRIRTEGVRIGTWLVQFGPFVNFC